MVRTAELGPAYSIEEAVGSKADLQQLQSYTVALTVKWNEGHIAVQRTHFVVYNYESSLHCT